jgi:iron(III) transport system permease protein
MRRTHAYLVFAVTALVLGVGFLWPLVLVVRSGFIADGRFTLQHLVGVFRNPIYAEGLLNSLGIAVGTTAMTVLIGLPLAWLSNRYDFRGKGVLSGLLLVPMVLPPFVGAIGLQQILGQYGALNAALRLGPVDWLGRGGPWGVILLQSLGLYPILYLNAAAALANVDPAMDEAAENLGATGLRKFRRITLPLIMPGLFAGGTLVFIWSFTELGTPMIMNYNRCAPVQVFDALKDIGSDPFPFALVSVMLACSMLLYAGSRLALGRGGHAMQGKAAGSFAARRTKGFRSAVVALPFLAVTAVALLPHVAVVLTSFSVPGSWYRSVIPLAWTGQHYVEALSHEMTLRCIRNSLVFSGLAVCGNALLGLAIAFVIVRSNLRLRGWLDALAMMPLAVPGLVLSFGYLAVSAQWANASWVREHPGVGALLDVRSNPTLFLVMAYAMRRLPYMVRSAVAGLQQTSVTFEEAAATLGATPWAIVRRVTLPLIMANLVAGALLAFAFSMLEVSDGLMLAQRTDFFPITKTIYELYQLIGTGRHLATALGVWAMAFLTVTIVGSSLLLGRKMGALFRA